MRATRRLGLLLAITLLSGMLPTLPVTPADAAPQAKPKVSTARAALVMATEELGLPGVPPSVPSGSVSAEKSRQIAPSGKAQTASKHVQTVDAAVSESVAVAAVTVPVGTTDVEVYLRQFSQGQPTPWQKIELDVASGDAGAPTAGTDPIVVTEAQRVQVATVSAEPVSAELALVQSTAVTTAAASTDFAWNDPQIRSRTLWGAAPPKYAYTTAKVTGVMIHHTAGTNSYTAEQVPQILRDIQAYHQNVRGWNDIAYNILVDKYGRAWEGRGGGVNKAIQGGHAWGVTNERVFGLSFMGNFDTAAPSSTMLDTAARVIAWKFRIHGVDPNSQTWGSGGQDGGSTVLNAISGHRDENATACPGQYVYAKFASIRAAVTTHLVTSYPPSPPVTPPSPPTPVAPPALTGLEGYDPGNLITDTAFYNSSTLSLTSIENFLATKGSACVANGGTPCLKDYRTDTPAMPLTSYCQALAAVSGSSAADIISRVSSVCGINPEVLIVLIQRESGLVLASGTSLSPSAYAKATGAGCPDSQACDPTQAGFFMQVYSAAERFKKYRANPSAYSYKVGANQIQYHPDLACGKASITIANQATAGLYIYTPYTPNQSALAVGTGPGDECSSYGNRNFFRYMKEWFPTSMTTSSASPIEPSPASTLPRLTNGAFRPLPPARLLDTRTGEGAPQTPLIANQTLEVAIAGRAGIPKTGVSAVVLNVTVTNARSDGWVALYPKGEPRPTVSNVNFTAGQTIPNLVTVKVGAEGKVALLAGSTGSLDVLADVAGFYYSGTPTQPGTYTALSPARLLDTREGLGAPQGPVAAGQTRELQVTGVSGIPDNTAAVVLNVTVTGPRAAGYVTVYPSGASRPPTSNLNFVPRSSVASLVTAKIGAGGKVSLYNGSADTTELVADVAGYYLGGLPTERGTFVALEPARILDTRTGTGAPTGRVASISSLRLQVGDQGGVPTNAGSVIMNVTVTETTSAGFVTAFPTGAMRPLASNLNYLAGMTTPNSVVVKMGVNGKVELFTVASTHLIADVAGYFIW